MSRCSQLSKYVFEADAAKAGLKVPRSVCSAAPSAVPNLVRETVL